MGQTTDRLPDGGRNAESSRLIDAAVQEVVRTNERRAAVEAAVAPPGQMRQRLTVAALAVAVPVLLLSFMTNVLGVSLGSLFTPAPPAAVARREAEDALRQAVQEIESYRRDFAELPTTLSQVGVPVNGEWSYVYSNGQYRLALRLHSQTVSFDSSEKAASGAAPR